MSFTKFPAQPYDIGCRCRATSTAKAGLILDKHRRPVGFDKDVGSLQRYMISFVDVYAS